MLGVIERVAAEGVSHDRMEAVLHQLELHQREISGDGYPYGLQLILQALGCATHYSDPIAVLDLEPVIAGLRERSRTRTTSASWPGSLLLDNPHRVTLVMTPDTQLSAQRNAPRPRALPPSRPPWMGRPAPRYSSWRRIWPTASSEPMLQTSCRRLN